MRKMWRGIRWVTIALAVVLLSAIGLAWAPDRPVANLAARWAKPPSHFVTIDGMQVHLRDEGPRDDPTPLVLLHGTGSSLHSWQGWADRLTATHRVIRFDRPGFGLTGPNPSNDYSMRYNADFLARLLDRLKVRRAIVAGNSSGGRMAWEFAVAHPDRVEALVLLAPAGYLRSTPMPMGLQIAMSPWAGPLLERILPRSQLRQGLESNFGDPGKVTDEMVDRSYELTLRAGNRRALGETLRQVQGVDNSAAIQKVRVPTLILWGTRDPVIPPSPDASRYARDIRGAALVMLPGRGHLPHEEDPDATVAALNAFLARQSTTPPARRSL